MSLFHTDARTKGAEGVGAWGVLTASEEIQRQILAALDAAEQVGRIIPVQDPWGILLLTDRRLILARDEAGLTIRAFPLTSTIDSVSEGRRRVRVRLLDGMGSSLEFRLRARDLDALVAHSAGWSRTTADPASSEAPDGVTAWPVYPALADEADGTDRDAAFPLYGQQPWDAPQPPVQPTRDDSSPDPSLAALAQRIATGRRDCTDLHALAEVPESLSKDHFPPEALKARKKARHQVRLARLFFNDAEKDSRSMSARWSSISLGESCLDSARTWLGLTPPASPDL